MTSTRPKLLRHHYDCSIVSEIVDTTIEHESVECGDDDVKCVFYKLMQEKDLDVREKKSAIIDFISAGIETVRFRVW